MSSPTAEAVSRLAADTAAKYSTDTIILLGKGPQLTRCIRGCSATR